MAKKLSLSYQDIEDSLKALKSAIVRIFSGKFLFVGNMF